jgi:hypothetical protein
MEDPDLPGSSQTTGNSVNPVNMGLTDISIEHSLHNSPGLPVQPYPLTPHHLHTGTSPYDMFFRNMTSQPSTRTAYHPATYYTDSPYAPTTPSSESQSVLGAPISDVDVSMGPSDIQSNSEDELEQTYEDAMISVLGPRSARGDTPQLDTTIDAGTFDLPAAGGVSPDPGLQAVSTEQTYTRTPLTTEELALKGQTLKNLIAERYGPPDFPNTMYGYVRPGQQRKDPKGRVGDVRFKVLANGRESDESQSAFERRMSDESKAKKLGKVDLAQQKVSSEVQEIVAAVDKAASSKKRKERKVRALIKH